MNIILALVLLSMRPMPQAPLPVCSFQLPPGTACRWPGPFEEAPVCSPELAPGTICRWPSDAMTLRMSHPTHDAWKLVSIIEGPSYPPVDPRAVRIFWHLALSEGWWICETGRDAGAYAVEVIADGWCPP